jgi:hypothetical protein
MSIEKLHPVVTGIRDVQDIAGRGDVLRVAEMCVVEALDAGRADRRQVTAVALEDLDAIIPAIADG